MTANKEKETNFTFVFQSSGGLEGPV